MSEFIYSNCYSIPKELCKDIIQFFEEEDIIKLPGITQGGLNKNVKNTLDFKIPVNCHETSKWYKVNQLLYNELHSNLEIYLKTLNNKPSYKNNNTFDDYKLIPDKFLIEDVFQIQKYEKNVGKYIYHQDFSIDYSNKKHRVITYLWYLNDVMEGGETEFNGEINIKPTAGKLILFPASWTYPHMGKMPVSNDKYIITGWLYSTNIF